MRSLPWRQIMYRTHKQLFKRSFSDVQYIHDILHRDRLAATDLFSLGCPVSSSFVDGPVIQTKYLPPRETDTGFAVSFWLKRYKSDDFIGGLPASAKVSNSFVKDTVVLSAVIDDRNDELIVRAVSFSREAQSAGSLKFNASQISDGEWHHIVYSSSPSGDYFFIDGKVQGSMIPGSAMRNVPQFFSLGLWKSVFGSISNFRNFRCAMDEVEVQELYTCETVRVNGDSVDLGWAIRLYEMLGLPTPPKTTFTFSFSESSIVWAGELQWTPNISLLRNPLIGFDDSKHELKIQAPLFCREVLAAGLLAGTITLDGSNLIDGEWHHIVYSSSIACDSFFIDGDLHGFLGPGSNERNTPHYFVFGLWKSIFGSMCNFRHLRYAMNDAEVQEMYEREKVRVNGNSVDLGWAIRLLEMMYESWGAPDMSWKP
ncbi:hypothetical protein BCR33DRAFT_792905 [Rhizoclosmatium globosum]|uniref:Concanavalin A-like lectin/glucanase n=1 Tax=Rhizoclosmatium globosum TaxID=329046 RepID=A0A1Y2B4G6_9FUNG|nr:hypothetical protein BCR33DRAFT_792905 [Rhizoclosmatium globosum]|eukprot:ORY29729.1 hypothetical protein BCR33DRAFT_792905 [Rhizoclosmatium globosum]